MKSYKKKKEETIFLKEINGLLLSSKEIEKNYFLSQSQNNINSKVENEKNNLSEDKKLLERKMRSLKYILKNLEKNYGFNSPYHNEFKDKINSKENENMTQEISNNILELYLSKKFNLCYNLWRKYEFQLLLGISEEKNFDMLKYLNKVRDRYDIRINLIKKIKERDENNKSNFNNLNKTHYSNIDINNSNSQNNSRISNNELYNLKLSENEKILQTLKRQINNIKNGKK
jgi:hypothetical protein